MICESPEVFERRPGLLLPMSPRGCVCTLQHMRGTCSVESRAGDLMMSIKGMAWMSHVRHFRGFVAINFSICRGTPLPMFLMYASPSQASVTSSQLF
jgi:hypothetical protein